MLFKTCYFYLLNKLFYSTVSLNKLLSVREIDTLKTWRKETECLDYLPELFFFGN